MRQGDGYELLLPASEAGVWRNWQITATVTGSAGSLTVAGEAFGETAPDAPSWLVPAVMLTIIAVCVITLRVSSRRAKKEQDSA